MVMNIKNYALFGLCLALAIETTLLLKVNKPLPVVSLGWADSQNKFDREHYILEVLNGNSDAAMILARHYGVLEITEAQCYWLRKAREMDSEKVSQEVVDGCEAAVFNEWR